MVSLRRHRRSAKHKAKAAEMGIEEEEEEGEVYRCEACDTVHSTKANLKAHRRSAGHKAKVARWVWRRRWRRGSLAVHRGTARHKAKVAEMGLEGDEE
ncbi:hypothetical protein C8A00DRAFT_33756 [Chaetomidium leptoderma]|uniref:C2H2-type domain-containing protein n=1 Tax=Chaetomidium leptoderma TaxID=669021 RepID=A0AAN6VL16_9PEZI|nr:hypothetical protein C8A00DRAFT_33756 [Chaetomidium leptoderma]